MSAATCPSCVGILKKLPTRKTKCPACGEFIYVKRAPGETEKRLVTEAEAQRIEALWYAHEMRDSYLRMLAMHDISAPEFDAMKATLRPNFNGEMLGWNAAWALINNALANDKDLHSRKMMFFSLARLAEERGMEFRKYLSEAHKSEILSYQHRDQRGLVVGVKIDTPAHACDVCKSNHGKRYSLEQAFVQMPLPCSGCTCRGNGYCICGYMAIFKTDRDNIT